MTPHPLLEFGGFETVQALKLKILAPDLQLLIRQSKHALDLLELARIVLDELDRIGFVTWREPPFRWETEQTGHDLSLSGSH
jgi:hypothetical protein